MHDPVLDRLSKRLSQGVVQARVVRFQSRGAQSGTSASWTGTTEVNDYQAVVRASCESFAQKWPGTKGVHLILAVRLFILAQLVTFDSV